MSDYQHIRFSMSEVTSEQLAAAARTLSALAVAKGGTAAELREALLMIGFPESSLRSGL